MKSGLPSSSKAAFGAWNSDRKCTSVQCSFSCNHFALWSRGGGFFITSNHVSVAVSFIEPLLGRCLPSPATRMWWTSCWAVWFGRYCTSVRVQFKVWPISQGLFLGSSPSTLRPGPWLDERGMPSASPQCLITNWEPFHYQTRSATVCRFGFTTANLSARDDSVKILV